MTGKTYVCIDCPPDANVHPRTSSRGREPLRCPEHRAAKSKAQTAERLNRLRASDGRPPINEKSGAQVTVHEDEEEEVPVVEPPPEKTWLDDADAQELLRQKREREVATGVPYNPEIHGSVEDYLAAQQAAADPIADVPVETSTTADVDMGDGATPAEAAEETTEEEPEYTHPEVCIADCGSPNPPHPGGFCPNHWQRVSLEERNILLGSTPGSEGFMGAVRRALARLRS